MRTIACLVAVVLAASLTSAGAMAAPGPSGKLIRSSTKAKRKPVLILKTVERLPGPCIRAIVGVKHFKLVKPVTKPPLPMLPKNQGHIRYVINNSVRMSAKTTRTFCRAAGVHKGVDTIRVSLVNGENIPIKGVPTVSRTIRIR